MSTPTTTETPVQQETHQVFIGNLSFSSTNESIKDHFSSAGEVIQVVIIKKGSRLKGFGFVGFKSLNEAEKAVKNLDKTELDGRDISVQLAKPRQEPIVEKKKKKRRPAKKSRQQQSVSDNEQEEEKEKETPTIEEQVKPKTSVFVANLPLSVRMNDLAELFKDYQVESALVAIKRNGASKGYGFVELKSVEEMEKVLKECTGFEINGRPLHLSAATSEKNTERRVKPTNKKKPVVEEKEEAAITSTGENKMKKKSPRKNKKSKQKKEQEGIEAAHHAQDAVFELKEKDGVNAAHKAQDAVRELKEENGVDAAHKAQKAVKELKGKDGVEAAHKAQGAVKDLKKKDGIEGAHKAQEAVKDSKKKDGVDGAHKAQDAVKDLKKTDGVESANAADKKDDDVTTKIA